MRTLTLAAVVAFVVAAPLNGMPVCASLVAAQSPRMTPPAPTLRPPTPIKCDSCAAWNAPRPPKKIFGNTYSVGVAGIESVLIVTKAGLILADGALPQSVPLIDANITALGFHTRDIKLILSSHGHFDHIGGIAPLQHFTGATVLASPATARALALGHAVPEDPQFVADAKDLEFPSLAQHVRVVKDGEAVTLGDVTVTAHFTPGHTPGATSWTWRSCEGETCRSVAYVDSLNPISLGTFRYTGDATHPSIVASFRKSIATVASLPCDLMITVHPGNAATTCVALAAAATRALDERVEKERGIVRFRPH